MSYVTKDSGERQDFSSGARRDISTGKTRYDLIPVKALHRWGDLMGRGAEKYGDRNWERGMPASRFFESALRHLYTYIEGDRAEDHLAAVLFNIGAIIHFEDTEWDDINGANDRIEFASEVDLYMGDTSILKNDDPIAFKSMVNWEQLRLDVDAGKIDGETVAWPTTES